MKKNIFITGFSGSGKTSVGRTAASRLGWQFVDTDDLIVKRVGKPISEVFAQSGEPFFRELERESLIEAASGESRVISTGGGLPMDETNRRIMEQRGLVVCLEARPETIHSRLEKESRQRGAIVRPMLEAEDPPARIRSLKADRQPGYALSHWTVHTDDMTPDEAAAEVIRAWRILADDGHRPEPVERPNDSPDYGPDLASVVHTSQDRYPVWVGWDIIGGLGERAVKLVGPSTAFVIGDTGAREHAERARTSLDDAGIAAHLYVMQAGEQNKTLQSADAIYGWLAKSRAERKHLVVAVGGGMVGDLAGFAAATYLRGMPFAQVPTTLLAMLDASIGGKTAVDLSHGKNLVGAFHQPRFVLSDASTLTSLSARERTAGWAEGIKKGLILDPDLLDLFEQQRDAIISLDPDQATGIIRRSVSIKGSVVSRDEKETLGLRALLNYGHTIGHALEAATGYSALLHGEAVSIGMMGAGYIGNRLGMLSDADLHRQRSILESYGLPLTCPGLDADAVTEAMKSDKKTQDSNIHWVLLDGIGNAVTRTGVPPELVRETLAWLAR